MQKETVVKEYIREVLLREFEDEFGIGLGSDDLYNAFVKPFANVFGVAGAELAKTGRRVLTGLSVVVESVLSSFIPFLSADFNDIWKRHKESITGIEQKFAKYYDGVWDAFDNGDVFMMSFLYSPLSMFTNPVLRRAPGAFMSFLEKTEINVTTSKRGFHTGADKYSGGGGKHGDEYIGSYFEGVVREDSSKAAAAVEKMASDEVRRAVAASPIVKASTKEARAAVNGYLNKVYARAKAIAGANSVDELSRLTKDRIDTAKLKKVPQEKRAEAEKAIMKSVKSASKKFYVAELKKVIEQALKTGVPSSSPFILAYKKAIEQIGKL